MQDVTLDAILEEHFRVERLNGGIIYRGVMYEPKRTGKKNYKWIYVPSSSEPASERFGYVLDTLDFTTIEMARARKFAKIYRIALLDESLPVMDMDNVFGRALLIEYLAKAGCRESVPEMREVALHATDDFYRESALRGLGVLRASECVPDLVKALRNESKLNIKRYIVDALGKMRDERAAEALREFYEDCMRQYELAKIKKLKLGDFIGIAEDIARVFTALLTVGGPLASQTEQELRTPLDDIDRLIFGQAGKKGAGMAPNQEEHKWVFN